MTTQLVCTLHTSGVCINASSINWQVHLRGKTNCRQ